MFFSQFYDENFTKVIEAVFICTTVLTSEKRWQTIENVIYLFI